MFQNVLLNISGEKLTTRLRDKTFRSLLRMVSLLSQLSFCQYGKPNNSIFHFNLSKRKPNLALPTYSHNQPTYSSLYYNASINIYLGPQKSAASLLLSTVIFRPTGSSKYLNKLRGLSFYFFCANSMWLSHFFYVQCMKSDKQAHLAISSHCNRESVQKA